MQQPRPNTSRTLRAGNALFDQPQSGSPKAFAAITASQIFLLPNANRAMVSVFNNSGSNLYLAFGNVATLSLHTVKIPPFALYELPIPVWAGYISGACDVANTGQIQVTET